MEETLIIAMAFGLFVFVIGGSGLAFFTFFRSRSLEGRIRRLEEELAAARGAAGAPRPSAPSEPFRPSEASRASELPEPSELRETGRPAFDLEILIAGRWLNRIGLLAVLLGTSFFLKYAFENDWIGPAGRVAVGLAAGTALLVASRWFLARGLRYFSEGIAALGAGILFLSLYAAWDFYTLIPQSAAFGGMILVTVALAGLAHARSSQRLAALALLGGLATPGLLSTGVDSQHTLFAYLLALIAGLLALSWIDNWRSIAPIALPGFALYFFFWFGEFYADPKLLPTLSWATAFFALFATLGALESRRSDALRLSQICTALANALWFGFSLHLMLYDDHPGWLTLAVLVLAAGHLALARGAGTVVGRYLFAGLALAFATSAIPISLEGEWIRTALAIEGAALVWSGFRTGVRALRSIGLAILAAVVVLLFDGSGETGKFVLNSRFLAFLTTATALAFSSHWARAGVERIDESERRLFDLALLTANAVAVWGISEEVWRLLGTSTWGFDPKLARQLGLSLLWTACASLLIAVGVSKRHPALRWQGLFLIALAVFKVFFFDLSFLERGYRIVSFVVLGLVLLSLSFFYQRGLSRNRE